MVYTDENVKEWVNDSLKTLWSLRNNTWGCSPTSTLSLSYSLSRTQSFWLLSRRKITKEGKGVEKKSSGGGGGRGMTKRHRETRGPERERKPLVRAVLSSQSIHCTLLLFSFEMLCVHFLPLPQTHLHCQANWMLLNTVWNPPPLPCVITVPFFHGDSKDSGTLYHSFALGPHLEGE